MGFFGSFRFGSGLFDGVADSFRDALKTFTLIPKEETAEEVINNEIRAMNQELKRTMDYVKQQTTIPQKKKNVRQRP